MDERKDESAEVTRRKENAATPSGATTGDAGARSSGGLPGEDRRTDRDSRGAYDSFVYSRTGQSVERQDFTNGYDNASRKSPVALMRHLIADVALLFRKEAALAAAELNQSVHGVSTAVGSMVSGGAILHAGIIFLLAAVAVGLAQVMALWLATLIVGGIVTLIGIVMVQAGKRKLQPASLKPERTADSLRKDKDALKRHTQ